MAKERVTCGVTGIRTRATFSAVRALTQSSIDCGCKVESVTGSKSVFCLFFRSWLRQNNRKHDLSNSHQEDHRNRATRQFVVVVSMGTVGPWEIVIEDEFEDNTFVIWLGLDLPESLFAFGRQQSCPPRALKSRVATLLFWNYEAAVFYCNLWYAVFHVLRGHVVR
jgi:hypothetical protein